MRLKAKNQPNKKRKKDKNILPIRATGLLLSWPMLYVSENKQKKKGAKKHPRNSTHLLSYYSLPQNQINDKKKPKKKVYK